MNDSVDNAARKTIMPVVQDILCKLLNSDEPSIRYKIRVHVLDEDPDSMAIKRLQQEIRHSPRAKALLQRRNPEGYLEPVRNPYIKWRGAHWVLASLADIGYPRGDPDLRPAVDQVISCWLDPYYWEKVPLIAGRYRRCASQQSNALYAALCLSDPGNARLRDLVRLLLKWQWPDGGWNCDMRPEADNSSFWESLIPLRALSLYGRLNKDPAALEAGRRAAEVFLSRRMYRRRSTGEVMNPAFTELHYPCYWRYDILFGLKVMAEAGLVNRPECADALDLLESKRLPDGGWPAEAKFYRQSGNPQDRPSSNIDLAGWGGISKRNANEWVTADALYVLKSAGRL